MKKEGCVEAGITECCYRLQECVIYLCFCYDCNSNYTETWNEKKHHVGSRLTACPGNYATVPYLLIETHY